jgi:RimJ/RimL family protein N-acetyltransferase
MLPMSQATVKTERILLVPLSEEHLEHEVELDADPEVMRYLGKGRARTRAEVEVAHRGRLAAADQIPGLGYWAGFVAGQFVGWWHLKPPSRAGQGPEDGQAELGYRLLRRCWRQGLASEGARELIRHGFEGLGLKRIFAETMAVNAASRATMTAVGMQRIRTFHRSWFEPLPGSDLGGVEYAITRQQWLAQRALPGELAAAVSPGRRARQRTDGHRHLSCSRHEIGMRSRERAHPITKERCR